jgi:hypothetical protein
MGTLAELSNSVSSLIQAHPSMKADLDSLLSQIANLEAPEIGIRVDEGRVQQVERFNEAPFTIYVHEHSVEGAWEKPSELVWNDGRSEPVIMSTYHLHNVFQKWDGPYWYSLRNPTEYRPPHDNDDEALAA